MASPIQRSTSQKRCLSSKTEVALLPTRRAIDYQAFETPYTLVFDLDDTLAHSKDDDGNFFDERPGLRDLLQLIHGKSENVIWTCGMRVYASRFVKGITYTVKQSVYPTFAHVLYRDRRWYSEENPVKPLRLLGRDYRHVLIVENNEAAVLAEDIPRAVIVPDYHGGPHDDGIPFLCELINGLYQSDGEDVESVLARSPLLRKSKKGYYYLRTI